MAFKEYWEQKPKIGATHYLAVGRNETRGLMAQSSDADIVFTLDPVTLKRLQKFKRISTYTASLPRTVVIKLNCAVPGLDSAELIKALSDGLDRKGISLTVMRLENAAAHQLFPKSLGPWHIDALNTPSRIPLNYKELMTAKGWKENEDGYLQKDGKPLELTLVTYSDRPELPTAATALQDQIRKMGIQLNISITNSSAIPQGHKEGTLEMGLIARNYGLISNPLGTVLQDYSKGGGDWGAMNWESGAMQDLLAKLRNTTDPEMQKNYIQTTSKLLGQEMPTIPVVSYLHTAVTSKEIVNFSLDPLERSYRITELNWSNRQ
jgi:peptide/nickel transport system substrate-binding protein